MGKKGFASIIFILGILIVAGIIVGGAVLYKKIGSPSFSYNFTFEGQIKKVVGKTVCGPYEIEYVTPFLPGENQGIREDYCLQGEGLDNYEGIYAQIQGDLIETKYEPPAYDPKNPTQQPAGTVTVKSINVKKITKLISVETDKKEYNAGETAKVNISNFSNRPVWFLFNDPGDNTPPAEFIKKKAWESLQAGKSKSVEIKIPAERTTGRWYITAYLNYDNPAKDPVIPEKTFIISRNPLWW